MVELNTKLDSQSEKSKIFDRTHENGNENTKQIGIKNPIFTTFESLESKIEGKNEINYLNRTHSIDSDKKAILPKANRFIQIRPSFNSFDHVDIKIFDRIYTIKKRTFVNYKKSVEIIKPYLVFIVMLIILLTVFRVDLFVNNPDDFEE